MPSFDIAMPIALFVVVTVSMLLSKRIENRLMQSVEQKSFRTRDIVVLIAFMAIVISVIAYTTMISPGETLQNILLIIFLSSYTMLLFTFSYVFSNLSYTRAIIFSVAFGGAATLAGVACLAGLLIDSLTIYRVVAFFGLAVFCFGCAIYVRIRRVARPRWYIAAQPPALFVLLFVFFNVLGNTGTAIIWAPYLMDVFGFTFAILIIIYLSSLFNWKTVGIFAVLLTTMDIILVIGTGTMVQAATQFTGLGLPVLVYLPNVPFVYSDTGTILSRGLGLGDFFFAGVLAVQTYKKFGRNIALVSVLSMSVAFGIWEAFLRDILSYLDPIVGRGIGGFPGTLMIVSGWVPIIAIALLTHRGKPDPRTLTAQPTGEQPKEPNLPIQ